MMKLTTRIASATDRWLALEVLELPDLKAVARNFDDIPRAVTTAAAALTGRPADEFDVDVKL